jgi:hypothetical protein
MEQHTDDELDRSAFRACCYNMRKIHPLDPKKEQDRYLWKAFKEIRPRFDSSVDFRTFLVEAGYCEVPDLQKAADIYLESER